MTGVAVAKVARGQLPLATATPDPEVLVCVSSCSQYNFEILNHFFPYRVISTVKSYGNKYMIHYKG